jgi:F0F1-type ATP synthase assembly protein I
MNKENNSDNLEQRIKQAKEKSSIAPPEKEQKGAASSDGNMGVGMRAGMEFVVSIVVSVLLGIWLDKTFDTKPLFFIALFFLGVITGFVNVWRVTQGIGSAIGYKNLQDQSKDKKK